MQNNSVKASTIYNWLKPEETMSQSEFNLFDKWIDIFAKADRTNLATTIDKVEHLF